MLRRRTITYVRRSSLCRWLSSKEVITSDDYMLESASTTVEEDSDLSIGNLAKVKDFFQKNKPPPKPAPPLPKKKWLLQMQPDPEEVIDAPEELPPIGDVEAEKEWLNFGNQPTTRVEQPLISETKEFRQMAREIEYEMDPRRAALHRTPARAKYIHAFRSKTAPVGWKERINRPGLDGEVLHEHWAQQNWSKDAEEMEDYSELNAYLKQELQNSEKQEKTHSEDGFLDIMTAMKDNQRTHFQQDSTVDSPSTQGLGTDTSTVTGQNTESTVQSGTVSETQSMAPVIDDDKLKEEAVYRQLISEDLSEDAIHPADDTATSYDYNPRHPRWLDPPDGETVAAPPQREFNDFVPPRSLEDFYTESSSDLFEDPGQDPAKSDRHKLYGQEYWVARPMLMEKYDYGDDGVSYEARPVDKHKNLDPEIPRHFVKDDGSIQELAIPETDTYVDFYNTSSKTNIPDEKLLYTTSVGNARYTTTVSFDQSDIRINRRLLAGYTVLKSKSKSRQKVRLEDEVRDWLYDKADDRDPSYHPHYLVQDIPQFKELSDDKELKEKMDRFTQRQMVVPTVERIEEIKLIEGLSSPQPIHQDDLDTLAAIGQESNYHDKIESRDLQLLMEAESRYRDVFSNEASDQLPDLKLSQTEQLQQLRQLNQPNTAETRPLNQLLRQPSRADYDPWLLRELKRYRKEDGDRYEDIFSLVTHPRSLEIAFASLRQRRPASVPRSVESNFFEIASRMLTTGELRPDVAATPRRPPKNLGKGARSTRIPSHYIKRDSKGDKMNLI